LEPVIRSEAKNLRSRAINNLQDSLSPSAPQNDASFFQHTPKISPLIVAVFTGQHSASGRFLKFLGAMAQRTLKPEAGRGKIASRKTFCILAGLEI
jgi:hypothetical protein